MSVSQQIKLEHDSYIDKICNSQELRKIAKNFFVDFCKFFEGQTFTKDNFETLVIDGKETLQDIVLDLFKNKTEIPAEEVYLYLLKNNYNSLNFIEKNKKNKISGRNNAVYKSIEIVNEDLNEQNKELLAEKTKFFIETIYHELSHIFEIKSFKKRQYLKNGLTNKVICLNKNKTESISYLHSYNISKKDVKLNPKSTPSLSYNIAKIAENLYADGYYAISEIANETFALLVANKFSLVDNSDVFNLCDGDFARKAKVNAKSYYTKDYDILCLMQLATGADWKDLRFNPKKVFTLLNNLDISKDSLSFAKDDFCYLFEKTSPPGWQGIFKDISNTISDCDISTTIALVMGQTLRVENSKISQSVDSYKIIVQNLLIEAIKNNIEKDLANNEVKKDSAFFENLNSTLEKIDQIICYPVDIKEYYKKTHDPLFPRKYYKTTVDTFSANEFAKEYPDFYHLVNFADLIQNIQDYLQKNNQNQTMPFLVKQQNLDSAFKKIINEDKEAKSEMEKAKNVGFNNRYGLNDISGWLKNRKDKTLSD